jgi:hypothetical protein
LTRRVLALILLALALVVCVALAASESLTNRTGRTATAVTVTFSEEVRITSYDESVFPTKEPSSCSDTFRFSGGELENGARFSISWTPSGAEITSTEWETTGAASSGSAASGAPLTYEEIMAQIAQYPGPDEPLYVPAEGEQIWLTDLEGHADIYDNDSIKINYAPGFDKSQITRIDVYRNGVKMRFVPALLDVLTNEQMKTLDGNPAESSPASKHADHAIAGYGYRFSIYGAANRSIAVPSATVKPGTVYAPPFAAVCLDKFWPDTLIALDVPSRIRFFESLGALGFTAISVHVLDYIEWPGNRIYSQSAYDSGAGVIRTPTDTEIEAAVSAIHAAGLSVDIRYEITYREDDTREAATQGQQIHRDTTLPASAYVFSQIAERVAGLATLLERQKQPTIVDYVTPFTENRTLARNASATVEVLDAIAEVSDVRIIYELHSCILLAEHPEFATGGDDTQIRKEIGTFYDWTDDEGRPLIIGFSDWYQELDTERDQHFSVMAANVYNRYSPLVEWFHANYHGHEIVMAEYGTCNHDGAILGGVPPSWEECTSDFQEMADFHAAYLTAFRALELGGFSMWHYTAWTTIDDASLTKKGHWWVNGTPVNDIFRGYLSS